MRGVVCLHATPRVQCSLAWATDDCSIISCHSRDCKALLDKSLTHVSSAIAGTGTFFYLFTGVSIALLYSVRQKKVSPKVVCHFLSNHLEFLREILHIYYLFIYT